MVGRYRLRNSGFTVFIRHPLLDMWVLEEIFRLKAYDFPAEIAVRLRELERPMRVVDLGGYVGLFGLFVFQSHPNSELVSFEPDPENARLLASCIEANGLSERWRLVEGCAATSDGTTEFMSSGPLSRAAPESDPGHERVRARIRGAFPFLEGTALLTPTPYEVKKLDVFPYLADADVVKIDIEGGEWELLADPRFADIQAMAIALEYHAPYGPGPDADEVVRDAMRKAGYQTQAPVRRFDTATIWAWKP
jgi:FkbM family methyltransferase